MCSVSCKRRAVIESKESGSTRTDNSIEDSTEQLVKTLRDELNAEHEWNTREVQQLKHALKDGDAIIK